MSHPYEQKKHVQLFPYSLGVNDQSIASQFKINNQEGKTCIAILAITTRARRESTRLRALELVLECITKLPGKEQHLFCPMILFDESSARRGIEISKLKPVDISFVVVDHKAGLELKDTFKDVMSVWKKLPIPNAGQIEAQELIVWDVRKHKKAHWLPCVGLAKMKASDAPIIRR